MKWSGCNYWLNQGNHSEEPIGTASSMHTCDGCEYDNSCPLQQENQIWPYDEDHLKRSTEVTNEYKHKEKIEWVRKQEK